MPSEFENVEDNSKKSSLMDWLRDDDAHPIPISDHPRAAGAGTAASDGNDTLIGDEGENLLEGLGGDDRLEGAGGADTLDGGAGDDILLDGDGADLVLGGAGRDLIVAAVGDAAADRYDGGDGFDRLSLEHVRSGMTVDLAAQRMAKSDASDVADQVVNIENVSGSGFADTLIGDAGANILSGSGGADLLDGGAGVDRLFGGTGDDTLIGGAGNNRLNGGSGKDMADYSRAGGAVMVDLAAGTAADNGEGGQDILIAIEDVIGGDAADRISGNVEANHLQGGGGDDSLEGGAGADTLDGGAGEDFLVDGEGADIFLGGDDRDLFIAADGDNAQDRFDGGAGIDRISLEQLGGGMTVDLQNQQMFRSDGAEPADQLVNIENVSGTGFADIIVGDAGENILSGSGGSDLILGGAGGDFLRGGSGDDTLLGGAGINTLIGGGNDDLLISVGEGDDLADTLIGGDGRDTFKLVGTGDIATIADFETQGDDKDVLDFADLLQAFLPDPDGEALAEFLQIRVDGSDTVINVDANGAQGGVAFDDAAITLADIDLTTFGDSQAEILQSLLDNQLLVV